MEATFVHGNSPCDHDMYLGVAPVNTRPRTEIALMISDNEIRVRILNCAAPNPPIDSNTSSNVGAEVESKTTRTVTY